MKKWPKSKNLTFIKLLVSEKSHSDYTPRTKYPSGHEVEVGRMGNTDLTRSQGFLNSRHLTSNGLTFALPPHGGVGGTKHVHMPEGVTEGGELSWFLKCKSKASQW